ncbi:MAG: hypothetical protein HQ494_15610 [Rhodospirillales bacterium]|nr:hypothetical protein [Rhodospirillales bacterium]
MTDKTKAKKLVDTLRNLVPGTNPEMVSQTIDLREELQILDEKIASDEEKINRLIFKAYKLTPEEIQMVIKG